MGFENDGLVPRPSAPAGGAPRKGAVVDDFAGAEDILRLKGGSGVGDVDLVINAKFVAGAGRGLRHLRDVPAAILACHRDRAVEHEVDAPGGRRPQPERHAVVGDLGPKLPLPHAGFRESIWIVHGPSCISNACSGHGTRDFLKLFWNEPPSR